MLIHDDIYSWEGWGGKLKLGSGKCRLRIFDLTKGGTRADSPGFSHLKPIIALVSDVPDSKMSVKSCTGHIATHVARDFGIDPHRMVWIEHYPEKTYGPKGEHTIPEKFERVDLDWHEGAAIKPRWRTLKPEMLEVVRDLVAETEA